MYHHRNVRFIQGPAQLPHKADLPTPEVLLLRALVPIVLPKLKPGHQPIADRAVHHHPPIAGQAAHPLPIADLALLHHPAVLLHPIAGRAVLPVHPLTTQAEADPQEAHLLQEVHLQEVPGVQVLLHTVPVEEGSSCNTHFSLQINIP
jgi:hypothetical protein